MKLKYLLFGSILCLFFVSNVDAMTLSNSRYNLYTNQMTSDTCTGSTGLNYKSLDTVSDTRGVPAYGRVDYLTEVQTLTSGNTYTFSVIQSFNPKIIPESINPSNFTYSIEASTTTSTSGLSSSNVSNVQCTFVNIDNAYQAKILCNFTASAAVKLLFVRVNFNCAVEWVDYFNTYTMRVDLEDSTSNAINNQTTIINNAINNQTNAINNIDGTLKDDNVDSDSNDMADYLQSFEFAGDSNISTLVTLPLTFLENVLIQESNADLCVTFRGKNICLPSGRILWGTSHSCNQNVLLCDSSVNVNAFKTIFSTIVGGYLCYKMARAIVHTIEKSLDPEDSKTEVVSL